MKLALKLTLKVIIIALLFLAGCKKSEWEIEKSIYSGGINSVYPFNGQKDVVVKTEIFINFKVPVNEESLLQSFILTSGTESVNGELYISPDKKFLKFSPAGELLPLREYRVILKGLKDESENEYLLPSDGIVSIFTTGDGKPKKSDKLKVATFDPKEDRVFDFSTFRITFTEPILSESVVKGDSFKFLKIETGEEVSGTLLVRGTRLVFDPEMDLEPDKEYHIELTENIRGIDGDNLDPFEINFFPIATGEKREMNLKIMTDVNDDSSDIENLPFSELVGIPANVIEINSKIIGKTNTIMKGILKSEMAEVTKFEDFIPVVLRKGQRIITSSSLLKLGGEVDTPLETGEITLTLLTDATGLITGNPFKEYSSNSPPGVFFTIDACLTASNSKINGVLNQDSLNVQLFGFITVEGENMLINIGGTTEIDLLGAEKAGVTLAMRLVTTTDVPEPDVMVPLISSISPLYGEEGVGIDSSVTITFSEPIKESSIVNRIKISSPGGDIAGNLRVEGSSVIFVPEVPFSGGTNYSVRVKPGIEDLNGNPLQTEFVSTFTTEVQNPDNPQALLLSSIFPGVPCVLKNPQPEPPGDAGECFANDDDTMKFSRFTVPSNRNIILFFTKIPDKNTITPDSFFIKDLETDSIVQGSIIVSGKKVLFIPDEPWIAGRHYELWLKGGTDSICDFGEICDLDGLPLNTDILDDGSETPGGADIVIPFVGDNPSQDSLLALLLANYTDTNSNGVVDPTPPLETQYSENSVVIRNAADDSVLGITYLSGMLIAEMSGYNLSKNAVLLNSLPGNWMFGTSTMIIILNSERMIMRPTGPAAGYISEPPPEETDRRPLLKIDMQLWMNAVNDLADIAIEDSPQLMQLSGRIDFLSDGRMVALLQNTNTVEISVLGGLITLRIKPGDVNVRAQMPTRF